MKPNRSSSPSPIRVLIAEDHTVVRDGLAAIINQQKDMTVVAETGDGHQAVELWRKQRPDVTLMDINLPGLIGRITDVVVPHDGHMDIVSGIEQKRSRWGGR